jgi:hypothetical protein
MSQPKNNYNNNNNKENKSQLSQPKKNNYKENYGTNRENINPVSKFLDELYNNNHDDLAKKFCRMNKKFESDVINITSNINRLKTSNKKSQFKFIYLNNKENNNCIEFTDKHKAKDFIINKYEEILNNLLAEIQSICNYTKNEKLNRLKEEIKTSFNILDEKIVTLDNKLFSLFEKKVKNINNKSQEIVMYHNQTDDVKLLKNKLNNNNRNCNNGKYITDWALTGGLCLISLGTWALYTHIAKRSFKIET